eukprot:3940089-Rhodomonas_salina.7
MTGPDASVVARCCRMRLCQRLCRGSTLISWTLPPAFNLTSTSSGLVPNSSKLLASPLALCRVLSDAKVGVVCAFWY